MDRDTSYRLLRIAYSGLRVPDNSHAESMGRDIYDLVCLKTYDMDLRYQIAECRAQGWDRLRCLQYLNHRLNIGLI